MKANVMLSLLAMTLVADESQSAQDGERCRPQGGTGAARMRRRVGAIAAPVAANDIYGRVGG